MEQQDPLCRCSHLKSQHSRNFCWAEGCEERHPFEPAPQELLDLLEA